VTRHDRTPTAQPWTGILGLDLRNGRDWSAGILEVDVRPDTVEIRHQGRMIAAMHRDRFREWIIRPGELPYLADETRWSVQAGITALTIRPGGYTYQVAPESLANLLAVM
jgi:hypothetical protein